MATRNSNRSHTPKTHVRVEVRCRQCQRRLAAVTPQPEGDHLVEINGTAYSRYVYDHPAISEDPNAPLLPTPDRVDQFATKPVDLHCDTCEKAGKSTERRVSWDRVWEMADGIEARVGFERQRSPVHYIG